jgi:hypothetical protein
VTAGGGELLLELHGFSFVGAETLDRHCDDPDLQV